MKELSTAKLLAILWVLYLFNILYADALSLMQTNAQVVTTQANQETIEQLLTDEMLLGAAIIIEMAIMMILLSLVLKVKINRIVNVVIASLQLCVLLYSATFADASYYFFFVIVESGILLMIITIALKWKSEEHQKPISAH